MAQTTLSLTIGVYDFTIIVYGILFDSLCRFFIYLQHTDIVSLSTYNDIDYLYKS